MSFGPISRPVHGTAVRVRAAVSALSELGCDVTVLSTEERAAPTAPPDGWRLVVLSRPPRHFVSVEMLRVLRSLAREADCVVVSSALLVGAWLLGSRRRPMLWDANECESLHYARLSPTPRVVARRLAWELLERASGSLSDRVVTISEVEAAHWRRLYPRFAHKLVVVPHRAEVVAGDPSRPVARGGGFFEGDGAVTLLFLGNMVAKHNMSAARWILAELAPVLPERARIVLVGRGSEAFGAVAPPNVTCLGEVADVDDVVAAADLCLAPLEAGAGVKTKVLHYLAHGKPVLGTPVAFEGLGGAPGCLACDLSRLAPAAAALADDPIGLHAARVAAAAAPGWLEVHHGPAAVKAAWAGALSGLEHLHPEN